MATLVKLPDAADFCGANDSDKNFDLALSGVEKYIQSLMGCNIELETIVNELYDGDGTSILYLNKIPVISVERLAVGRETGLTLKNTSTDATYAMAQVTSTVLRLLVKGGTNEHTWYDFTLADYTLAELGAAILVYGYGWTTATANTTYSTWQSTELLQRTGASCLNESVQLDIPDSPAQIFEVDMDIGEVILSGSAFSCGTNNVIASYTAGYSTTTSPKDLQVAILALLKIYWENRDDNSFGLKSFKLGDINKTFDTGKLPDVVLAALNKYGSVMGT